MKNLYNFLIVTIILFSCDNEETEFPSRSDNLLATVSISQSNNLIHQFEYPVPFVELVRLSNNYHNMNGSNSAEITELFSNGLNINSSKYYVSFDINILDSIATSEFLFPNNQATIASRVKGGGYPVKTQYTDDGSGYISTLRLIEPTPSDTADFICGDSIVDINYHLTSAPYKLSNASDDDPRFGGDFTYQDIEISSSFDGTDEILGSVSVSIVWKGKFRRAR